MYQYEEAWMSGILGIHEPNSPAGALAMQETREQSAHDYEY